VSCLTILILALNNVKLADFPPDIQVQHPGLIKMEIPDRNYCPISQPLEIIQKLISKATFNFKS
jgi:hypothetical protein